jgi:hypothetical protein
MHDGKSIDRGLRETQTDEAGRLQTRKDRGPWDGNPGRVGSLPGLSGNLQILCD